MCWWTWSRATRVTCPAMVPYLPLFYTLLELSCNGFKCRTFNHILLGRRSCGLEGVPLKICRRGQSMFWSPSPINVTFFHSKLLLDNSVSFTSLRMKDLCQKWKVKLIFRGTYRNRDWRVFFNHWRGVNLKQFDGLTWLTLTPMFYDRSMPLDL